MDYINKCTTGSEENDGVLGAFPLFPQPHEDGHPSGPRSQDRTKSSLRCVVCGDSSSGKHYGVLACNGCSGFFKRSVRKKLIYRCQAASGECLVDKAHRNQCQACRLKKCMESGMNKDAVQNERQPRNSATLCPEFPFNSVPKSYIKTPTNLLDSTLSDITVGVFSPFFNLPSKIFPPVPVSIPKYHQHEDLKEEVAAVESSAIKTASDEEQTHLPDPSIISLMDVKNGYVFDPTNVYETSARILMFTVRWAKSLPSYSSLCLEDQIALLNETWSELFLLGALQWGIPLDTNPLFSAVEADLSKLPSIQSQHLSILQKTFSRFKILAIDLAEFACLKAIILFKFDGGSLKDSYRVEILQDHALLMLAHHIKMQHIDYTFRFGRLLLLLPKLREIPRETVEAIFFNKIIGSTPMQKLLSDMINR